MVLEGQFRIQVYSFKRPTDFLGFGLIPYNKKGFWNQVEPILKTLVIIEIGGPEPHLSLSESVSRKKLYKK
jgi:hypothetical protein